MRTRRLALTKETLTELCAEDLVSVQAAAAQQITPVAACVENVTSMVIRCLSVFDPCPTR